MAIWQRLYNFVAGTRISSNQMDAELDQVINALNQHTNDIANGDTNTLNFFKNLGFGSIAADITGQDLNNLDVTGFYYGTNLTNAPSPVGYFVIHIKQSATYKTQLIIQNGTGSSIIYHRMNNFSSWQPWHKLLTDELPSWSNIVLQNGATVNNSRTPKYMKLGNTVYLEGEISSGLTNGTVIGTLPAGYRPAAYSLNTLGAAATSTLTTPCTWSVNISGQITLITSQNTLPVSLNNIQFVAEV